VLALFPQGHDDKFAARAVFHADVDEIWPLHVPHQQRAALSRRGPPGLQGLPHARGDLRARLERAAHTLQVALDGVGGDAYEGQSSRSSPISGDSGSSATRRTASRTPGMKLVRSVVTWRMVSVWATSPRITSWSATMPGSRREWIGTSPSISRAVRAAVPDGLSTFAAWWYSMISAAAMCREASAAKRIISTAPMAKFGAANTLPRAPPTASRSAASSH